MLTKTSEKSHLIKFYNISLSELLSVQQPSAFEVLSQKAAITKTQNKTKVHECFYFMQLKQPVNHTYQCTNNLVITC